MYVHVLHSCPNRFAMARLLASSEGATGSLIANGCQLRCGDDDNREQKLAAMRVLNFGMRLKLLRINSKLAFGQND
jgi:hypothetical protein